MIPMVVIYSWYWSFARGTGQWSFALGTGRLLVIIDWLLAPAVLDQFPGYVI